MADITNDGDVTTSPVILFDGVCILCNGFAQFLARHDHDRNLLFAHLQSDTGTRLLGQHNLPASDLTSVVLLKDGAAFQKSTAALRALAELGMPWKLLLVFLVCPRSLRDLVYDAVGRRRYQWFGKTDSCAIPHGELSKRILD